jgi:hypothetical protein
MIGAGETRFRFVSFSNMRNEIVQDRYGMVWPMAMVSAK